MTRTGTHVRDIDRLINHINQAEYLSPVSKQVLINRVNLRPTQDEIRLAMNDLEEEDGQPDE